MQKGIQHIESLQIINLLCNIINTQDYDEADYQISKFIINNLYNLEKYSIYEIAEEISVSRSTIRRFCIRMGYDNFSDLKKTLTEDFNFNILNSLDYKDFDGDDYDKFVNDLKLLPDAFDYENLMIQLKSLALLIKKSHRCTVFSTGMQLAFLKGFQVTMATVGKIIHLIDFSDRNEDYVSGYGPNDLIFIISWTGKFLSLLDDRLDSLKSKVCLVTFDDTKVTSDKFYKIYRIPKIKGFIGSDIFRFRIDYETDMSIRYTLPYICNLLNDIYFDENRKDLLDEIDC